VPVLNSLNLFKVLGQLLDLLLLVLNALFAVVELDDEAVDLRLQLIDSCVLLTKFVKTRRVYLSLIFQRLLKALYFLLEERNLADWRLSESCLVA
jgi:hypothetical protein